MIVRIDVQYWALFAEMPLFQSHKESWILVFNPLPFLMLRGANIFVLECDTVCIIMIVRIDVQQQQQFISTTAVDRQLKEFTRI